MPYKNIEDTIAWRKRYHAEHKKEHNEYCRNRYALCKKERLEYRIKNTRRIWASRSINNHRRKKIKICVSVDQLLEIANKTDKCPVCGVQLYWSKQSKRGKPKPTSPTLDRINNENEIRLDNIEILCSLCNRTKGERTKNEFLEYCKMYVEKFG